MVDYTYGEITNVKRFQHIGFPEWFSYKDEKKDEYIISTLDDSAVRYRIKGEDFDRLLFFRRCSQVLYSKGVIKYNKLDVIREFEDKPFE